MWALKKGRADTILRNLEELHAEWHADLGLSEGYKPNDERKKISLRFQGLDPQVLADYEVTLAYYTKKKDADYDAEIVRQGRRDCNAMRAELVRSAYAEIQGLVYDDGSAATIDDVAEFGLLEMLAHIASWWHRLPSAKKKRCGSAAQ